MRQRARISLYSPDMDTDIAYEAAECEECASRLPSLPQGTLKNHELAKRLFELLHTNIGEEESRHYLVTIDKFSGWPHVTMFQDKFTTVRRIADALRRVFTYVGVPLKLFPDNVFPAEELQSFLRDLGVSWGSSWPHYPQSNGRAESNESRNSWPDLGRERNLTQKKRQKRYFYPATHPILVGHLQPISDSINRLDTLSQFILVYSNPNNSNPLTI